MSNRNGNSLYLFCIIQILCACICICIPGTAEKIELGCLAKRWDYLARLPHLRDPIPRERHRYRSCHRRFASAGDLQRVEQCAEGFEDACIKVVKGQGPNLVDLCEDTVLTQVAKALLH